MNNVTAFVEELRKHGLSNGSSLGWHSGLMDEAADLIEKQQAELDKRTARATELYLKNKRIRQGLDELGERLRETRGADSPIYLAEKIEYAISVLDSYIKDAEPEESKK